MYYDTDIYNFFRHTGNALNTRPTTLDYTTKLNHTTKLNYTTSLGAQAVHRGKPASMNPSQKLVLTTVS